MRNIPLGVVAIGLFFKFNSISGLNCRHWTALTYSSLGGHHRTSKLLLERGAAPEGGAMDKDGAVVHPTETPLMLAAASGSMRMTEMLLSHGASPFFSTTGPEATGSGAGLGFNASSSGTYHQFT